jgi:hypothetical protein
MVTIMNKIKATMSEGIRAELTQEFEDAMYALEGEVASDE